jgi:copper binding plastocyanin/azurin family protein
VITHPQPVGISRRITRFVSVIGAGLLVGGSLVWLARRDEARVVTLTCRNMAYFLDGNPAPNPPLTLTAGERIQLHLVNHDAPGVLHDVAIDPLDVATGLVLPGQSAVLTFQVADRPGSYEYYCRPHASVMRGTVDVRAR